MLDFGQNEEANEKKSLAKDVDSQNIPDAEVKLEDQGDNLGNQDNAVVPGQVVKIYRKDLFIPEHHPRKDEADIKSLKNSISQKGILSPLTVYAADNGKCGIIDGSLRFLVAEELGIDPLTCHVSEDIDASEAAIQAYILNSVRNPFNAVEEAEFFSYLQETYSFTLQEIGLKVNKAAASISNSLKLLGLDDGVKQFIRVGKLTPAHGLEIAKLATSKEQLRMAKQCVDHEISAKKVKIRISQYHAKQAAKKNKKPRCQVPDGDIEGVYFKDNRDMSEFPNGSVQFVMGSPNYNIGKEFEADIPHDVHLAETAETCIEIGRVLAPGCTAAINISDIHNFPGKGNDNNTHTEPMIHKYVQMLRRHNIYLMDIVIWQKNKIWTPPRKFKVFNQDTAHASYRLLHNYEYILIFRKKGERELPSEDIVLNSKITKEQFVGWAPAVWHIPSVWKNEGHPTQYPDELCYRLIKMFSYEGDTVLDPWLGSGTTIKVARELNRVGIGYERDLRYKEVILQKLGVATEASRAAESTVSISNLAELNLDGYGSSAVDAQNESSQDQSKSEAEVSVNESDLSLEAAA